MHAIEERALSMRENSAERWPKVSFAIGLRHQSLGVAERQTAARSEMWLPVDRCIRAPSARPLVPGTEEAPVAHHLHDPSSKGPKVAPCHGMLPQRLIARKYPQAP